MNGFSVGIIPDGNRRYAKQANIPVEAAYLKGFEKISDVAKWAADTEIASMTFWAMSLENFTKRSQTELGIVFKIMTKYLDDLITSPRLKEEDLRIKFFGNLQLLPNEIVSRIRKLEEKTAENGRREVNFALIYGGKDELAQTAKKIAEEYKAGKIENIDEQTFQQHLLYQQPVDLVIRTGATHRLSGFLPWQAAYAELYFCDKLWPAMEKADFDQAIEFYKSTERRFGK